jgi:hypothetical protein
VSEFPRGTTKLKCQNEFYNNLSAALHQTAAAFLYAENENYGV